MVLLFTLFLISMYLLTSLLYTKKLALVTLVVLSLASPQLLFRELEALAGHPETPLFGAVLLLLTTWIALTWRRDPSPNSQRWRIIVYGIWGCIVGAAYWNDPLAAPFILTAGLFLALFCRDELCKATLLSISLGILIGVSPWLIYNVTMPLTQSSFSVFGFLVDPGHTLTHPSLLAEFAVALLVSLPVATEVTPLCPISHLESWPLTAQSSSHVIQCTVVHGFWGFAVIVLWAVAVFFAAKALQRSAMRATSSVERRPAIIQFARLMILASVGLAFLIFSLSTQPLVDPVANNRYLVTFAVATSPVLWPLWVAMSIPRTLSFWPILMKLLSFGLLLLLIATLVKGTIDAFNQVPSEKAHAQQQHALVYDLLRLHATHIYTDYWTCDITAFLSQEQIICAALDEQLQSALDRYTPYKTIVHNDPHPSYVFAVGSPQTVAFAAKIAQLGERYQRTVVDGYDVYQFQM